LTVNTSRHVTAAGLSNGFTLIELVVVMFIISILASLSLAGLAGANQRAKADKTRSTIRKLNELILPHYEHYMRRRVPAATGSLTQRQQAEDRLLKIRTLQMREMPDTWADVFPNVGTVDAIADAAYLKTAPVRAYAQVKAMVAGVANDFGAEECLHMVIARGGFEPDALETFRSDEIVDKDGDGAPEFVDGWGTPIGWLRWAPGFNSPDSFVQFSDATNYHDPFDPFRTDLAGYALVPLIVSAGPDRSFGLNVTTRQAAGWNSLDRSSLVSADGATGGPDGSGDRADNISNHAFAPK
jgi:prepilin-type N-terminal cleavage/methylation domain-containing protein